MSRPGVIFLSLALGLALPAAGAAASSSSGGAPLVPRQQPHGMVAADSSSSSSSSQVFSRTLRQGDSGDDVKTLQRWLDNLGYSVPVTGYFGSMTKQAVIQFQNAHHLYPASGTVGPRTARALYDAERKASDSSGGSGMTGAPKPPPGGGQSSAWVFPLWPISRVASTSYWSQDQGVDIPPWNPYCGYQVPEVAMTSGTIVAEGINGFGPYAPVLKIDSGQYKGWYLYYGHAAPDAVGVGAHVRAGQTIAYVGCGDVGYSSGPHIEIGLVPPNEGPCCPQVYETSGRMWNILTGLYYKAGGH